MVHPIHAAKRVQLSHSMTMRLTCWEVQWDQPWSAFFCHLSSPAGHMPRRSAILEGRQHRDSALHDDFELVLLKVEVRR